MNDAYSRFDAHVHIGWWKTPDFAGHGSGIAQVSRVLRQSGFTGALAMTTDQIDNQGLLSAIKAGTHEISFSFAAWAQPGDSSFALFLESNLDHICAIKTHPSFARKPISHDDYVFVLELARRHGLPVVVHCGRWQEVAGYNIVLDTARKWHDVSFVLAHMGGDSPALVSGAASRIHDEHIENAFLGTESIREYWLVGRALDVLGPSRLVFGSDHNLNHPASFVAVIDALGLEGADYQAIMGGNAYRLFHRANSL